MVEDHLVLMPKILQNNITVNFGSTGRIAEEIGQTAMANGWESYIAYGNEKGTVSKSQTFLIGNKCDFNNHAVKTRLFDRHGLASKRNTKRLVDYIESINPDVIHLHNIHGYFINYPILFEYLSSRTTPVVWTMHDCWSFTGHCAYFDMVGCDRWLTGCYSCPQKREYPASILLDRSRQNYIDKRRYFTSLKDLTLVPVSDWLARLTARSFFKGAPIHRIYNGVNIDIFKPQGDAAHDRVRAKYNFGDRLVLLGVASVWSPRKGLEDFIKLHNVIDDNFVIALVGLTAKQIELLPKGIIGISRTENIEELAGLYSVADIFINPTYEDNFPTTNIESLACGTPVITYKTGGSVEAVDSTTGLVVDQSDIAGLHKAITNIVNNRSVYSTEACRQRAIDHFDKSVRYMDYIMHYTKLISK